MAKSTEASRRVATIMRIVSFPFVLALLVVAVKFIAMSIIASLALAAFDDGDYEKSAEYSRWNLTANVIEPHKAHFGLGTAYLGLTLYQEARDELETALETAPLPDSCDVRLNLSYAIEGLGDTANGAGEFQQAADLYNEAIVVLQEADESCPPTDERQQDLQEKAEQAQQNADAQSDPQGGQNPPDPGEEDPDDAEGNTPIENLEDLLDESAQDKEENDAADRAYDNRDDFAEKPW